MKHRQTDRQTDTYTYILLVFLCTYRYKSLVSDALKSLETTREERRKKVCVSVRSVCLFEYVCLSVMSIVVVQVAEELRTKEHLQLLVATEVCPEIM